MTNMDGTAIVGQWVLRGTTTTTASTYDMVIKVVPEVRSLEKRQLCYWAYDYTGRRRYMRFLPVPGAKTEVYELWGAWW